MIVIESVDIRNPPGRRPRPGRVPLRPGSQAPMAVREIVTVCMGDLLPELGEFLPAARVAFPRVPIHVYTDHAVGALEIGVELHVDRLHVHPTRDLSGEVSLAAVAHHADHWQPWPIYWKLHALAERVAALPDGCRDGVLLADCDVIFREGLDRAMCGEVALSPFYWGRRDLPAPSGDRARRLQHEHGEFNAGLVLTRSIDFCAWWIAAYLSGEGGFYEQACLDAVPGRFHADYFSPLHNWGNWRFAAPPPEARSYHRHLAERSTRLDTGAIAIAARRTAAEARALLRKEAAA